MNFMSAQPAKRERRGGVKPRPAIEVAAPADADTPAERRKRKVRDTIIEAAENVFAQEGEAGLSMRRLADRIDYSPAAIYKYFASKDELLAAIREQFFERLLTRMSPEAEGASPAKRFRAGLRAYIQTGLENPNHYRMGFANIGSGPPTEGTRAYEAATTFTAMIVELIADGSFRKVDPQLASASAWASMHGLTNLLTSIPDFPRGLGPGSPPISRDALIEFHVEQVCRGLAHATA
jgi:AcrR family transcriptional regulator